MASTRCSILASCLLVLVLGCPGDDEGTTTEAASTGGTTAVTSSEGTTTAEPPATGSTGSDPGSTTSGSTSVADTSTGGPVISCDEATDARTCAMAGSADFSCGWFETRHFVLTNMMCMEVAQGGLCMTTSQGDDSCGIMREPSCMNSQNVVYVRPSAEQQDAIETLALEEFDACTGPDPGDGWELCVPGMMMPGCRCGCML